MSNHLFIGRSSEVLLLKKTLSPTGIPHRSITFIVGPSGVGKTATTLYTLDIIRKNNSILTIYLNFSKTYGSSGEAILDLIRQFEEHVRKTRGVFEKFIEWLKELKSRVESIQLGPLSIKTSGVSISTPITVFQDILSSFIEYLDKSSIRSVVVVDEIQNILKFSEWSPWGLMKFLMNLQEQYGYLQFVLVSSDYGFRNKIVSDTPIEYIDTFYLGEMVREDAVELVRQLLKLHANPHSISKNVDETVDLIGGFPAVIYRIVDYSVKYDAPLSKALNYIEKHMYEDVLRKTLLLKQRIGGDKWVHVWKLLRTLSEEPVYIHDIGIEYIDVVDWFVKWNIMQYGCRDYIGIYKWNRGSGGGFCGLDLVAPSNRIYYRVLKKITGSK